MISKNVDIIAVSCLLLGAGIYCRAKDATAQALLPLDRVHVEHLLEDSWPEGVTTVWRGHTLVVPLPPRPPAISLPSCPRAISLPRVSYQ